ncbi:AMP-binding protein [Chitinophaga oryzae]|uniref:AMP-binding protein n=1 Tax=Chitinophaga oryzae TaxID=2725414 RepID=A0ABX6LGX0_9BACT|nr:AMP-binding protein [Chitinophaga oryzae]QJB39312.1 AMP-binding protein [Chitinophaga oryzae]
METTVISLLEEQVKRAPNRTALVFEDQSITYNVLDSYSWEFAAYLKKRGIAAGSIVVMPCTPSIAAVIALIGILKAGCICVPGPVMDGLPALTGEQHLTTEDLSAFFSDIRNDFSDAETWQAPRPSQIALGCSCMQAGELLSHQSLLEAVTVHIAEHGMIPEDRCLLLGAPSDSTALVLLFMTLLSGANLIISDTGREDRWDSFPAFVEKHQLSFLLLAPSFIHYLQQPLLPSVRMLLSTAAVDVPVSRAAIKPSAGVSREEAIGREVMKHDHIRLASVHAGGSGASADSPVLTVFYAEVEKTEFVPSLGEYGLYDGFIYQSMAKDPMRVNGYRAALASKVKDKVVLDPGTGTEMILARHCIDAGARKVYAVEMLETAFHQAKNLVEQLGLSDKIFLIHGDATKVALPEPIDFVVSALAGNIASADGCISLINALKQQHGKSLRFIPNRYCTRIAAASLPPNSCRQGLSPVSLHYIKQVFLQAGKIFDLRMCLKNFSVQHIISEAGEVEDISYETHLEMDAGANVILNIRRKEVFTGLVLWINAFSDGQLVIDSLKKTHHLPVYFAVAEAGIPVDKGEQVFVSFRRTTAKDGYHPDYILSGEVLDVRGNTKAVFSCNSPHMGETFRTDLLMKQLFDVNGRPQKYFPLDTTGIAKQLKEMFGADMMAMEWKKVDRWPFGQHGETDLHKLPGVLDL